MARARRRAAPCLSLVVLGSISAGGFALDNGVARPPMGWVSWERFGCQRNCLDFPKDCINEDLFTSMANEMVEQGFRDAGYTFVNLDDCYLQRTRTAAGSLQADTVRFPNGVEGLSRLLHAKGLKLGVYTDIGSATCMGYPGLNVAPAQDAAKDAALKRDLHQMAEHWKIDLLKVDGCHADVGAMGRTFPKLSQLLNATGRRIVLGCSWPYSLSCDGAFDLYECFPYDKIAAACNTWRPYRDVMDAYNLPGQGGVRQIINTWAKYNHTLKLASKPGAYNDPDMLLAGNPGLSLAEATIQFGMWAMWSAPLLLSADLRTLDDASRRLLLNRDIIAVDQDPLGASATGRVLTKPFTPLFGNVSFWHKPLENGDVAVAWLNLGAFDGEHFEGSVEASDVGWPPGTLFKVRDLIRSKDLPGPVSRWSGIVAATSLTMLRLSAVDEPRIV